MIVGIGTDICSVDRIQKTGKSFRKKYFTEAEREYISGHSDRLAGIFAAKEAFVKAIGTGFIEIDLKSIEILHNEHGAPFYRLTGWAEKAASALECNAFFLSISHDGGYSIAICVIER